MSGQRKGHVPLPTRQQILEFVKGSQGKASKREIARAFALDPAGRIWLKRELKAMAADGVMTRQRGKRLTLAGQLPSVSALDITGRDVDGELLAKPADWYGEAPAPRIVMAPSQRGVPAIGVGDRVLARLIQNDDGDYEGRVIRLLETPPGQIVGVYRSLGAEGRIQPADKRDRHDLLVSVEHNAGALGGEVVVAQVLPGRPAGLRRAKIVERLGPLTDPRSFSLMAVHAHGLPVEFSPAALTEATAAKPVRLGTRSDLRRLPLVTIDPEDARDHDDAVYAEADADPDNPGGFRVVVAIADVGWYVRPGSALDAEARRRGNSIYFPDRVVPMLPEALSTDLCSLVEGKSRACMAVEIWFDRSGNKRRHHFLRGLMRSAASLTYSQVQAAYDGRPDKATDALLDSVIRPLYAAYDALAAARDRRQPLALELPERRVNIGADGYIESVGTRERLTAHKLIEEFMIAANVCAAESLEQMGEPCMYRIHEEPAADKLDALRDFLDSIGLKLARGQVMRPAVLNQVLARAAGSPHELLVNEVMLRSQSQAVYSPENLGHFGLNLARYGHFTSPIRRYADLLVHRALVSGGRLGAGGLSAEDRERFEATAELISGTERRAMLAEREAMDRFTAAYMADRVGASFMGRISGVTRFGLFVKLDESGADGLVMISSLGDDYYHHDEARHALVGRRTGKQYQLGDRVEVRLAEADVVTGGLRLEMLRDAGRSTAATASAKDAKRPGGGRPGGGRPGHGKPSGGRPGTAPKRSKPPRRRQVNKD